MMIMAVVEWCSICQYGGESGVDDGGGVADDDGADGVDGVDDDANGGVGGQAYTLNFTAHQSSSEMVPVNKTLSKHDHT